MEERANAILKLCLAAGALLAGGGIAFYYGIHLPSQDIRRQTEALVAERASEAEQDRALHEHARRAEEQARRARAARAEYDSCVAMADDAYARRWQRSCELQHEADVARFDDCADNLFATRRGCLAKYPIREAEGCALPQQTAQSYARTRDTRKEECAARLDAVQREAIPADGENAQGA